MVHQVAQSRPGRTLRGACRASELAGVIGVQRTDGQICCQGTLQTIAHSRHEPYPVLMHAPAGSVTAGSEAEPRERSARLQRLHASHQATLTAASLTASRENPKPDTMVLPTVPGSTKPPPSRARDSRTRGSMRGDSRGLNMSDRLMSTDNISTRLLTTSPHKAAQVEKAKRERQMRMELDELHKAEVSDCSRRMLTIQ